MCVYVYVCAGVCVCVVLRMYVCVLMCVCMYVCVCVCVYLCVCVYVCLGSYQMDRLTKPPTLTNVYNNPRQWGIRGVIFSAYFFALPADSAKNTFKVFVLHAISNKKTINVSSTRTI